MTIPFTLDSALKMQASITHEGALRALEVGRRLFLEGARIDAGAIAAEVGVNRTTLYRWFGGRDEMVCEVIWSFSQEMIAYADSCASGQGVARLLDGMGLFIRQVVANAGYIHFLRNEPEAAARVLFTSEFSLRNRLVPVLKAYIDQERPAQPGDPDSHALAMAIVRISEAFIYGDQMGDGQPDLDELRKIYQLLLPART